MAEMFFSSLYAFTYIIISGKKLKFLYPFWVRKGKTIF